MKPLKILCIAPYPELGDIYKRVSQKFPDISEYVFVGNLDDALVITKSMHLDDYDIITSRGGTAEMLQKHINKPVIPIEITVYDMLRVIRTAQLTGQKFAIVGYASIINASRTLCDILKYEIPLYQIDDSSEVENLLLRLSKEGVDLFIGDTITVKTATKIGTNSLFITSGEESIEQSLLDAQSLWKNIDLIQQSNNLYKHFLTVKNDSVIIFNENRELIFLNRTPLNMNLSSYIKWFDKYIDELFQSETLSVIKRVNSRRIAIQGLRYEEDGHTFYGFFLNETYLQENSKFTAITVLNHDELNNSPNMKLFSSDTLNYINDKFKALTTRLPIFLHGEHGTGRTLLAKYLHTNYYKNKSLFVVIDCATLSEKEWATFINDTDSALYGDNGTLHLKNIDKLSIPMQKRIHFFFADTKILQRFNIIYSSTMSIQTLIGRSGLEDNHFLHSVGFSVYLPSLNERIDDIPQLSSLFISRYNIQFSKQVIGFSEDALCALKEYKWTRNISELELAVKQFVATCNSSYISLIDVRNILPAQKTPLTSSLDLNKTLDEIEADIIRQTLVEENHNQSAAAKRLGISRSTLWRKINRERK